MHVTMANNRYSSDFENGLSDCEQSPLVCWVSGYFRHRSPNILFDREAAEYAVALYKDNQLLNEAHSLNGSFVLMLCDRSNKTTFVVTDRLGSVPLYYGRHKEQIFISDDYWQIVRDIQEPRLNKIAVSQLVQFSYVLGTHTLIEGVSEFPSHSITKIEYSQEPRLEKLDYWFFRLNEGNLSSEKVLLDGLSYVFDSIFQIYSQAIIQRKWFAGIPLSGGLDSRLIAWGLKKNSVPSTAYSYGTPGYPDLDIANLVAKTFGIHLEEILWTDEEAFIGVPHDVIVKAIGFTTFYAQGVGSYAISKECQGKCDVILPGHTGDFISGSHISDLNLLATNSWLGKLAVERTHKIITNQDLKKLYPWTSSNWHEVQNRFNQTLASQNDPSPLSLTQRWDMEQRQRRYILKECSLYKLFGSRVMIPFWDYEVIDFFTTLPRKYLYKQYLYRKWMQDRVYVGEYDNFGKIKTPRGEILPRGTEAGVPNILQLTSRISRLVFDKYVPKRTPNLSSRTLNSSFWNIWYYSPEMKQYFLNLFKNSTNCNNLFAIETLNMFIQQEQTNFVEFLLYSLGTIAHPIFDNYE
jgi:asparagine synthase (glutamine-hydrolysing)